MRHPQHPASIIAVGAILLGMAGCIHHPARSASEVPRTHLPACSGTRYVDVDNTLRVPVKVYSNIVNRVVLLEEVAAASSQRIPLPPHAVYVRAFAKGYGNIEQRRNHSPVRLTIGCEHAE